MKTTRVGCVLVCVALTVGLAAAAGPVKKGALTKNLGVPTTDPDVPVPVVRVEVQNFPALQAVGGTISVDNLPAIQTVGGTVSVDNLPALQSVSGTVSVGNLPLSDDGSIRVATAPARQPVVVDLMQAPVDVGTDVRTYDIPTTVDASGYSKVGLYAVGSGSLYAVMNWRWADDEDFVTVYDSSTGVDGLVCGSHVNMRTRILCPNEQGRVQITVSNPGSQPATLFSVRVYLFP
jgi:hypothetical protein